MNSKFKLSMRPKPFSHKALRHQGSVLVIAIFIITVMFLLTGALIRVLNDGDDSLVLEVWGARALFTANSGVEVGLARLFPLTGGVTDCAAVGSAWTPPNEIGFSDCQVELACTKTTVAGMTQFAISSNAVCQSGQCDGGVSGDASQCIRVNRQVEVQARVN
ncbi:MSHA biogenesis protein MshP [Shewanella sp. SNU WT4]|uniref:MSHA biogenesis protein MshP n=1 Tax=Shewanella sp. SNU WT4 TaxID=2590015 RepID=UPI001125C31D|nr:MSHA biogenesis protein MshP [Shewanella sp. SNU WT4]QDF68308.1 MSHA biogenesis protein MshP [Shewanella sp. SNU WT4]